MNKWLIIGLVICILGYCSRSNQRTFDSNAQTELRPEQQQCDADCLQAEAMQAEIVRDYEKALELNQELAQLLPNNAAAENAVAGLQGILGRYEEEIAWAKKALSSNPRYEQAYINWGNALLAQKQYANAYERFSRAQAINPQSAMALYHMGLTLE